MLRTDGEKLCACQWAAQLARPRPSGTAARDVEESHRAKQVAMSHPHTSSSLFTLKKPELRHEPDLFAAPSKVLQGHGLAADQMHHHAASR